MATMTDQQHADDIRAKAQALYDACHSARADGLKVSEPLLYMTWLITGKGPGGPADWHISRSTF